MHGVLNYTTRRKIFAIYTAQEPGATTQPTFNRKMFDGCHGVMKLFLFLTHCCCYKRRRRRRVYYNPNWKWWHSPQDMKERKKLGKMPKPWPGGKTLFRSFLLFLLRPVFSSDIPYIIQAIYTFIIHVIYLLVHTVRQQRYTYFALLWLLFGSLGSLPTSSRSDTYRTSQNSSSSSLCCYLRQIQHNLSFFRPHNHTHTAE